MIPRYNIKRIKNRLNTSGLTYAPPRLDLPTLPPALPFTIDELKISVYPTDAYNTNEEGLAQEILHFRDEVQKVLSKYVKELQEFSLPYTFRSDPQVGYDNFYGVFSVPMSFTIDKLGLQRLFQIFGSYFSVDPDFELKIEFSNSDGDWTFFDEGEQIFVRIGDGEYKELLPVQKGNIKDTRRRNRLIAKKIGQLLSVDRIYEAGSIRFQLGESYLIGVPNSLFVSPEGTYFSITDFHLSSAARGASLRATSDAVILLDRLRMEYRYISAQIDASSPWGPERMIELFMDAGFTDLNNSTVFEAVGIYQNQGETINLRTNWAPFLNRYVTPDRTF